MSTELSVPAADETRKTKKETRKIADTAGGFLVTTSHWPIKQVTPRLYTLLFFIFLFLVYAICKITTTATTPTIAMGIKITVAVTTEVF